MSHPSAHMAHVGMMFVSKAAYAVATTVALDGTFALTLRLTDRWGNKLGQIESYLLTWTGAEARAWWQRHSTDLGPGTPLRVDYHSQQVHLTPERYPRAEIRGNLKSLQLLPTAANVAHNKKSAASPCGVSAECY